MLKFLPVSLLIYKCLNCANCICNASTCRPHCEHFPVHTVILQPSALHSHVAHTDSLMLHAAMLQCKRCTTGIWASQAKALLLKLTPQGVVLSFLFLSHRQELSAGGIAGGDGAEVWPYASAGHRGICPSATLDTDRHIEVRLTQT